MASDPAVATLVAVIGVSLRTGFALAASASPWLAATASGLAGRCCSVSLLHPGGPLLFREEQFAGLLGLRLLLLVALLGGLEPADVFLYGEGVEVEQDLDRACHLRELRRDDREKLANDVRLADLHAEHTELRHEGRQSHTEVVDVLGVGELDGLDLLLQRHRLRFTHPGHPEPHHLHRLPRLPRRCLDG